MKCKQYEIDLRALRHDLAAIVGKLTTRDMMTKLRFNDHVSARPCESKVDPFLFCDNAAICQLMIDDVFNAQGSQECTDALVANLVRPSIEKVSESPRNLRLCQSNSPVQISTCEGVIRSFEVEQRSYGRLLITGYPRSCSKVL